LEDAARQYNTKILFGNVITLKGSSHSGLVSVKYRNGATISEMERVKEMDRIYRIIGKAIDKNEKLCDTLDVEEDSFCE